MTAPIREEIFRYLKAPVGSVDEGVIEEILSEVYGQIVPKSRTAHFDIQKTADGVKLVGTDVELRGNLVKRVFAEAVGCVVIVATLGLASERLLSKYEKCNMARAVIVDAALTAYIEEYLDGAEAEYDTAHDRISCGYGDFSIEYQRQLTALVDAEKQLGVHLNDSNMLLPNKTVTALFPLK